MAIGNNNRQEFEFFGRPYYRYRGKVTPQNLAFDANLQEFNYRVGIICSLENNGKIPPQEAYRQISILWHQLGMSQQNLFQAEDGEASNA